LLNRLTSRGGSRAARSRSVLDDLQHVNVRPTPQLYPRRPSNDTHTSNNFNDLVRRELDMSNVDAASVSTGETGSIMSSLPSLASLSMGSSRSPLDAEVPKSYAPMFKSLPAVPQSPRLSLFHKTLPSLSSIVEDFNDGVVSKGSISPQDFAPIKARLGRSDILYRAVSKGAPHSDVKDILKRDSSAGRDKQNGSMPALHVAIERYDTTHITLLMLLESNPAAAAVRFNAQNAVDLLWVRFATPAEYRSEFIKCRAMQLQGMLHDIATWDTEAHAHRALEGCNDLRDFWDIMSNFIYAACHTCVGTYNPASPSRKIVHDAICLNCDPLFLRFAIALHPQQLLECNKAGRVPLHLAALHCSSASLLAVLQLEFRAATRMDYQGKLPLHLAIEAGVTWHGGLLDLIQAYPQSLSIPCPATALLPCMLAASQKEASLTTIFCLLLENPAEICQHV